MRIPLIKYFQRTKLERHSQAPELIYQWRSMWLWAEKVGS